jgi:hypothetical protein
MLKKFVRFAVRLAISFLAVLALALTYEIFRAIVVQIVESR